MVFLPHTRHNFEIKVRICFIRGEILFFFFLPESILFQNSGDLDLPSEAL